MKKLLLFVSISLILGVAFSLNFNGLRNSEKFFDLESVF